MDAELKGHLSNRETWKRGLFMLLFALIYSVVEVVLTAVVLFQFAVSVITGRPNRRLINFGQQLATYIYQIILFLTYKSEEKPYPFDAWPKSAPRRPAASRRPAVSDERQESSES